MLYFCLNKIVERRVRAFVVTTVVCAFFSGAAVAATQETNSASTEAPATALESKADSGDIAPAESSVTRKGPVQDKKGNNGGQGAKSAEKPLENGSIVIAEQPAFAAEELAEFREGGFVDGWRIVYKNQIDSGFQGISPAVANDRIDAIIQSYSSAPLSDDELKALKPLGQYLNLLFPELDISETPLLTQYQSDRLFNLAFYIQSVPRQADVVPALLSSAEKTLTAIRRKIRRYFIQDGICDVAVIFSASHEPDAILAITVSALEQQGAADCINRPDIVEFEGETLWVNRIELLGAQNLGAISVSQKDIQNIIRRERREKTGYLANGIEGFSAAELVDLSDYISDVYYASKGGILTEAELKDMSRRVMRLRRGRGITFEELEEIADSLKTYYRARGLILANVYVPQQEFQYARGELYLAIQPGILGSVEVRGLENLHYDERAIVRAFDPYIGHNVSDNITDAYFLINSLPGLSIQSGLFEPGKNPGETKLVLDVTERQFRFSLNTDNYGTRQTGVNRYLITMDWLNPSGSGDLLSAGYLRTSSPSNSNLGFLNYQLPIFDAKTSFTMSFDTNIYESQRAISELSSQISALIEGQTYNFNTGFNRKVEANKDLNMSFAVLASYKKADTNTQILNNGKQVSIQKGIDETYGASVSWHTDFLVPQMRSVFAFDFAVNYGETDFALARRKDGAAVFYTGQALSNTLIPIAGVVKSKLTTRFRGTWTDKVLPSYDQFSLGGPFGVRAFSSSAFVGDAGAFGAIEWTVDIMGAMPWRGVVAEHTLDIGPFYEEGYSTLYALTADGIDDWANFAGYGFSVRYEWNRDFVIDTSVSWPTKARISTGSTTDLENDGLGQQFLFSLRYIFD
ncbi:Uncharacterised protein [BD1-7 clade bacterium]|nr:Uncharacterised protein [BD1-7 clade bacterium]